MDYENHLEKKHDKKNPFTGAEYLQSLQDGREVYFHGRRIEDVTSHPALAQTAKSVARLYDSLHNPEFQTRLCWRVDTPNAGLTHKFFRCAESADDLYQQREAMTTWARLSYGWLARSPDYKGSFNQTLGMNPELFGKFSSHARSWYQRIQDSCLYLNHAIVTPAETKNGVVQELFHLEKETDGGIYVSGAKIVATNAALNQALFISHVANRAVAQDADCATSFIVPINAKGLKLILRSSYENQAKQSGSVQDYPLSSRFDENDAILLMKNVFVPWEDVLIYRDAETCKKWSELFSAIFPFHACTRLAVKMDFICALFEASLKATGKQHRAVKVKLGEVIAWRNLFWSLTEAMCSSPTSGPNGKVLPNARAVASFRVFSGMVHSVVRGLVYESMSSGLIYAPSSFADLQNTELNQLLAEYMPSADGSSHQHRIQLVKLLWDAVGSEFAGRNELFEMNNAGGPEVARLKNLALVEQNGDLDEMNQLLQNFLKSD